MPTTTSRVTLDELPDGGARMTIEATFPSSDVMDQMLAMGAEEGITSAVGQIDELLRAEVTPR